MQLPDETDSSSFEKFKQDTLKKKRFIRQLGFASLALAGLLVFALFIHHPWPSKILALSGLLGTAILVASTLRQTSPMIVLGLGKPGRGVYVYSLAALILGLALGIITRLHFKLTLLPATLTLVALIAPLTGAMEELVFRGYLQGMLIPQNRFVALIYAALAHTVYKVLVIYSLGRPLEFDFLFLAQWTLLGGLAFGGLRLFSRSLIPPLIAHAVFDILVYGGSLTFPFWVWS
jgi:membrane protease YdiL (CAAX protease family)